MKINKVEWNIPEWETNDYDGGYEDFLDAMSPYNQITQEEKDELEQYSKEFRKKLKAIADREGRYYAI